MNYWAKQTSLEHMALLKIAQGMWNQHKIGYGPLTCFWDEDIENWFVWLTVENEVLKRVSALPLPQALKGKVSSFVRPIGLEIINWWCYHNFENRDLVESWPSKFFWTDQGTVDNKKTAAWLLKDEKFDVEKRYRLACMYCLEDEIRALWKQIPDDRKNQYFDNQTGGLVHGFDNGDLVVFWTCTINDCRAKLDEFIVQRCWEARLPRLFAFSRYQSPHLYAFNCATWSSNQSACEYFLQKLSSEEKDRFLVESACWVTRCRLPNNNMEIICFLLSQMNEKQQMEMFKRCYTSLLECLLIWPWQSFFVETAKRYWHLMTSDDQGEYIRVVRLITYKICCGHKYCDNNELFVEFFQLCSSNSSFKKFFIQSNEGFFILLNLFEAEEEELVKFVLNQLSSAQIEKLIFPSKRESEENTLIHREKWDFLNFLMDQIPEEIMINCKTNILNYLDGQSERENVAAVEFKIKCCKCLQLFFEFNKDKSRKRRIQNENDDIAKWKRQNVE